MKNRVRVPASLLIILFALSSFTSLLRPHLVGTVTIKEVGKKIQLIATLDKTTLAYAARQEGDCSTPDLMKKSGSKYFLTHFKIQVNGKNVRFQMKSMKPAGDKVCITFEETEIVGGIKSMRVSCNYFQEINGGAQTQILMNIQEQSSSFMLDQHKVSNLISYNSL